MFYFPHIPKAGGTTLKRLYYQAFGVNKCLRVWSTASGSDVSADDFVNITASSLHKYDAVVGHLPLSKFFQNAEALKMMRRGEVQIITAVRDPIDRMISLFNYIKHTEVHPHYKKLQTMPAQEFFCEQPANFQFNFLAFNTIDNVDALFSIMNIVPMKESITAFKGYLEIFLDKKLNEVNVQNRTADIAAGTGLFNRSMLSEKEVCELEADHQLDLALYQESIRKGLFSPSAQRDRY